MAGDYADGGSHIDPAWGYDLQAIADEAYSEGYQDADKVTLYHLAGKHFEDVSERAKEAMKADSYLAGDLAERHA